MKKGPQTTQKHCGFKLGTIALDIGECYERRNLKQFAKQGLFLF